MFDHNNLHDLLLNVQTQDSHIWRCDISKYDTLVQWLIKKAEEP